MPFDSADTTIATVHGSLLPTTRGARLRIACTLAILAFPAVVLAATAGIRDRPAPPLRGSSAMIHGGTSAERVGGSSVDKSGIAADEAKKSPQERAAEHAARQEEIRAAKKAKEEARNSQGYPGD